MALNTVSSERLSTNVKTSNLGSELKGKVGERKNLVVNGSMQISQRASSFTGVDQQEYTVDQFVTLHSYGSSTINVINSSESPDDFAKSYKVDVTAADTSIGAGQFMFIRHKLEAQNLTQLAYGTSEAKSITLSFYVRSNVTGTYAICLQQKDNSSKQVNGTYTINSADTWEKKTFTYAGDTSGVINDDNGHGLDILWTLVAGSNRTSGSVRSTWTAHADADESVGHTANVLSSTSNNWHLAGVQLEVGSVATDFEHLSFADELRRCQRYYFRIPYQGVMGNSGVMLGSGKETGSTARCCVIFPVPMRAVPSCAASNLLADDETSATSANTVNQVLAGSTEPDRSRIQFTGGSYSSGNSFSLTTSATTNSYLEGSAEL